MKILRPKTIEEVKKIQASYSGKIQFLAGGTDLMIEARLESYQFKEYLVDLSLISEMNKISVKKNQISIGACVTHNQIVNEKPIQNFASLLSDACRNIGSQQIRNRGTIGGNICNGSPCADSVPALMALGTEVKIVSANGERSIPLNEFYDKPYHPLKKEDEFVSEIIIQNLTSDQKSSFVKLGRRNALAIARLNMAVVLGLNENQKIQEVRIVPGSVFPIWQRVKEAEEFLIGKKADADLFAQAGKIVAEKMIQISGRRWSTEYKEPVVQALVKQALLKAVNSG